MPSPGEKIRRLLRSGRGRSLARWWAVGAFFTLFSTAALYLITAFAHLPLPAGTLIAAEIGAVLRFFVNDRWVFGNPRPTWRRLWQYQLANGGSFIVWWSVANLLPLVGINYLIASLAATVFSVGVSLATHFRWIWRRDTEAGRTDAP